MSRSRHWCAASDMAGAGVVAPVVFISFRPLSVPVPVPAVGEVAAAGAATTATIADVFHSTAVASLASCATEVAVSSSSSSRSSGRVAARIEAARAAVVASNSARIARLARWAASAAHLKAKTAMRQSQRELRAWGAQEDEMPPNSLTSAAESPSKCTCKKSRCLQMYCVCFARGELCDGCSCENCHNNSPLDSSSRQVMLGKVKID
jgi:hypothetical protein